MDLLHNEKRFSVAEKTVGKPAYQRSTIMLFDKGMVGIAGGKELIFSILQSIGAKVFTFKGKYFIVFDSDSLKQYESLKGESNPIQWNGFIRSEWKQL